MLRDLLLATQDKNLRSLCRPLHSTSHFHSFSDINDLSSHIANLEEGSAVFVDVEWPNNQNGYNVAREIKKRQDDSVVFLIADRIDEVKLHWCAKVNAQMVEHTDVSFLGKFAPIAHSLNIPLPDEWKIYLGGQASRPSVPPTTQAEIELERILGPMGPLLLQEAMAATNGNLALALKKVAAYGTTAAERTQITNLSEQFS
ncbi:MAG: hypothetical protein V4568_09935 [Pseudomonadota bacterium]